MLYNIIGDIHGRTVWKDLLVDDGVNIFVGDYFSPYDNIPFDDLVNNFYDIIKYKEDHPNTILLLGNHDLEYFAVHENYSRHDFKNASKIKELFLEELDKFQLAYSIENKVLVTHAGVSIVWYDRYKNHTNSWIIADCNYDDPEELEIPYTREKVPYDSPIKYSLMASVDEAYEAYRKRYFKVAMNNDPGVGGIVEWNDNYWRWDGGKFTKYLVTPDEVASFINELWMNHKYSIFNFENNCGPTDYYGDDERHSPVWIRLSALNHSNIFKYSDYVQVFGHTINNEIFSNDKAKGRLLMVDCLQYKSDSLVYDSNHNTFIHRENLTMTPV